MMILLVQKVISIMGPLSTQLNTFLASLWHASDKVWDHGGLKPIPFLSDALPEMLKGMRAMAVDSSSKGLPKHSPLG
jgi:hypothetical protein